MKNINALRRVGGKKKFDDIVEDWFPLKNGNLIVKLEDNEDIDDYDKAKSINSMPSHFGSYISSHSKRLMNNVIREIVFTVMIFTMEILIVVKFIKNAGLL